MKTMTGFLMFLLGACLHAADRPPNIVLIFMDDMGYADIGSFGAEGYATPHLDRMAEEGRRFTDFYAAQAVCSASRAALLTGCYPNRIGISGALGPKAKHGLHDDEVTLAELCREKGYATAIFGKWHLGHHRPFLPLQHGFDEYFGYPYSNDMWPYHPGVRHLPMEERLKHWPHLPLIEGNEVVHAEVDEAVQTRMTGDITARAVDFITRNAEKPFFLYVPHPMVHVPLFVSDAFRGKSGAGLYGDVMMEIDDSVGRILETLRTTGLAEHTLVIFTSDNGPWLSYGDHAGSAGPLREGKGTSWEGGVRESALMWWPGTIPAGTVCETPAMTIDLFPTVAHLLGAALPGHPIDGKNIWPLVAGEPGAVSPQDAYFFYYGRNALEAMRMGKWKLQFPHGYRSLNGQPGGTGGIPSRYTRLRTELALYDLEKDIGERHDVKEQHPDVVKKMQALAAAKREELGDDLTRVKGRAVRAPGRL